MASERFQPSIKFESNVANNDSKFSVPNFISRLVEPNQFERWPVNNVTLVNNSKNGNLRETKLKFHTKIMPAKTNFFRMKQQAQTG